MKPKEKEQIEQMYREYGYKCFVCGRPANQRAHLIGQGIRNRKQFGGLTIDNPHNWRPVCGLECNALCDVGHSSNMPNNVYGVIRSSNTTDKQKKEELDRLIRENIKRKQSK